MVHWSSHLLHIINSRLTISRRFPIKGCYYTAGANSTSLNNKIILAWLLKLAYGLRFTAVVEQPLSTSTVRSPYACKVFIYSTLFNINVGC